MVDSAAAKNKDKHLSHSSSSATVLFAPAEVQVIREYYVIHSTPLPPGLEKKLARGKPLPPGWRKKLQPFPTQLETRLPYPCDYCGRGVADGYGVIYDKRTSIILDVVRLAGDILRN
jgi:hypothetical protein